jgi:hypothetical protein
VIKSLFQRTKHHQDNTRNPSSPKTMPPKRKQCTSAVIDLIIDHGFSPRRKPRSQNNAFNKAIARHNQLRSDLEFSPCKLRQYTSHVLSPPQADAAAPSQKSPSQNLIATMTWITNTSPQISAFMPFSATNFIMGQKTCLTMETDRRASHRSLWNQTVRKTWLRATEFNPIRQSPDMGRLIEFIGGAFRNSTLQRDQWRVCSK